MNPDLIREAAEWRLLSLLLECPGASWRASVRDLSAAVPDPLLKRAADRALEEAAEGLYHSAFGPGGPAAPREVSYSDSVELGSLVSEIEAYYAAFAYRPATSEAPDHISVEAGFLSFLLLKEAYAEASGEAEAARVVSQARRDFLRDHLSWVAEPLAAALENSGLDYLSEAARWLALQVGPSRERRALPGALLPVIPADDEFGCGSGDSVL